MEHWKPILYSCVLVIIVLYLFLFRTGYNYRDLLHIPWVYRELSCVWVCVCLCVCARVRARAGSSLLTHCLRLRLTELSSAGHISLFPLILTIQSLTRFLYSFNNHPIYFNFCLAFYPSLEHTISFPFLVIHPPHLPYRFFLISPSLPYSSLISFPVLSSDNNPW